MGDAAFFRALRHYVRVYQGEIATGTALLDVFETHRDRSLWPLFPRYVSYPRYRGGERRWEPRWPAEDTWTGAVTLGADQAAGLRVFIDDRPALVAGPGGLTLDTGRFLPGAYLITLVGVGPDGPLSEVARRVILQPAPGAPLPTPMSPQSPEALPTAPGPAGVFAWPPQYGLALGVVVFSALAVGGLRWLWSLVRPRRRRK